ncbi:MAG: hypothetical protein J1E65_09425 [Lachnospiraceae bacterium]|nr:hypothetical protein [Lachnospiraceae bacterium]
MVAFGHVAALALAVASAHMAALGPGAVSVFGVVSAHMAVPDLVAAPAYWVDL